MVQIQLADLQVAEGTGTGKSPDSEDTHSGLDLSPAGSDSAVTSQSSNDRPEVPFPFTWSARGFLPGGELPNDKVNNIWKAFEYMQCDPVDEVYYDDTPKIDKRSIELIKLALQARNQHFLDKCSSKGCDNSLDNKTLCKHCKLAKYCSPECAVFDIAHRRAHPYYPEISTCVAIEQLENVVTAPSCDLWVSSADGFCDVLGGVERASGPRCHCHQH